jgi:hypothetical protein
MSKRHKCCPFIFQSWLALAYFLICTFFMTMLQLYVDSLPDYSVSVEPLQDLGFMIIPFIGDSMRLIADVMVLIAIVTFLTIAIFMLKYPQLIIRRWLILLGTLFLLRGLVLVCDRYPRVPYKADKYQPSNPIVGALSILAGIHSTSTDFMYSGHTVNFVLAASFISRYTYYGIFSFFFWIYCVLGMLALIATQEHYLTDVITGYVITKLAFWCYHLFFDGIYKRFWVSGVEITDTGDVHLVFPIIMTDAMGSTMEINKKMISDEMIGNGRVSHTGQTVKILRMDPVNEMRYEAYKTIKWLDNE